MVPSPLLATHTDPTPTATPPRRRPTPIRLTSDALLATHAAPPLTAIGFGLLLTPARSPTPTHRSGVKRAGSTRDATPRVESTIHSARPSAATLSADPCVTTTLRDAGS